MSKAYELATVLGGGTLVTDTELSTALAGVGGGGKVLQVINTSSSFDTTSTSDEELYSATITPTSTTSKILILFSCAVQLDNGEYAKLSIHRGDLATGSNVYTLEDVGFNGTSGANRYQVSGQFLDSPATTAAQQYSIIGNNRYGASTRYGAGAHNPITLIEIAA